MRFMVTRAILALTASTFLLCSVEAFGQNIVLGILEDSPGRYYGDPNYRSVRVVFQKNGQDWQAFQSDCPDRDCGNAVVANYPAETTWTIAFDGKNLGKVTTRAPERHTLYSLGQQEIISGGPVPIVGKRTEEFMDASVYRPLVANSGPFF